MRAINLDPYPVNVSNYSIELFVPISRDFIIITLIGYFYMKHRRDRREVVTNEVLLFRLSILDSTSLFVKIDGKSRIPNGVVKNHPCDFVVRKFVLLEALNVLADRSRQFRCSSSYCFGQILASLF